MIRSFFRAIGAAIAVLLTPDGRRAWALVLLAGGGIFMTIYAAGALYFVRTHPAFVLSLGLAAHLSVIIVLTGFAGLLIKRTIKAGDGTRQLEISDQPDPTSTASADTVRAAAAGAAAGAVAGASSTDAQ